MFDISKVEDTVEIKVLVQFATSRGTTLQGDFIGVFKRLPSSEIDELIDGDLLPSETAERILTGAKGLANADGKELPSDEALAWVLKTPECVNASIAAFFKAMRPERYNEKTSRKRR